MSATLHPERCRYSQAYTTGCTHQEINHDTSYLRFAGRTRAGYDAAGYAEGIRGGVVRAHRLALGRTGVWPEASPPATPYGKRQLGWRNVAPAAFTPNAACRHIPGPDHCPVGGFPLAAASSTAGRNGRKPGWIGVRQEKRCRVMVHVSRIRIEFQVGHTRGQIH